GQQGRVGLEEVLVEVLVRDLAGAKRELAAQAAAGVDVGGERRVAGGLVNGAGGVRHVPDPPRSAAPAGDTTGLRSVPCVPPRPASPASARRSSPRCRPSPPAPAPSPSG